MIRKKPLASKDENKTRISIFESSNELIPR